jgi:hypothetical protein|tara:strand:+ start:595 stop:1002 length:408 start_codon:yes stop_codon:yes gene_type:complete
MYIRLIPTMGKVAARKDADVSSATIYRYRQASEGFNLEEAHAYAERLDRIEQEMESIALGESEGTSVQVNAANMILKANRSNYHNQNTTHLVGADGGAIQIQQTVDKQVVEDAVKQLQSQMLALPPAEDREDATS